VEAARNHRFRKQPGVTTIFDSSQIPGEILDLTVIRTDVLNRPDGQRFAKTLAGAFTKPWHTCRARDRRPTGFSPQWPRAPTHVVHGTAQHHSHALHSAAVLRLATSTEMKYKMTLVQQFCFHHGLLGENTKSTDDVAICYPDGAVQGKPDRVRLRFETTYMKLAAESKL
jgi:NitT/TauT family transport system substrate-binding protein